MEARRSRNMSRCPRSTAPLSSALIFLSWILPTSSFAQLTSSLPSTTNNPPPTLSTSTIRSSSSSSFPSSLNTPLAPTQPNPAPAAATSTNSSTTNDIGDHAFKYYFLIVAAFALLFCGCIILFSRRKKRKAAIMRSQSQRALARDVEGWRTRFRAGLGNNARENERQEGLDERGEAPPPYAPGSKPPSIPVHEIRTVDREQELESGTVSVGHKPPGYHEAASGGTEESAGDITMPRTAVTASERFGSVRGLLSTTGSSL